MKVKREYWILAIIFLFALVLRLFLTMQTPFFSSDYAYYVFRQVDNIKNTGLPIIYDELSYGGRIVIDPPLYYYTLAVFSFIMPVELAAKIIPNIFASLLVVVVYLLCYQITKNKQASLFSSFISAFLPIYVIKTINSASDYSIMVPLMITLLYFFIKSIENKKYANYYIFFMFVLALINMSIITLIIGFLIYLLLIKLEKFKYKRVEIELILFSCFLIIWLLLLLFKKAFLMHGYNVIWKNIPKQILASYFTPATILQGIYLIGLIPFIFGIYILYKYTFKEKNRNISLLIGFALSIMLLLWFKLIEPSMGLIFLSIILTVALSQFYKTFTKFIDKTKLFPYKKIIISLFLLIVIISSGYPTYTYALSEINNAVAREEIDALEWIRTNTPKNSIILGTLNEGHFIAHIAKRKNVLDFKFLLVQNADQRLTDIKTIYTTWSITDALTLLNKYNVNYILFSNRAKKLSNKDSLQYINEECFELVYDYNIKIYKVLCIMEENEIKTN